MGHKVSQYDNPADMYMRVLSINYPKTEEDDKKIQLLIDNYTNDQEKKMLQMDKDFLSPELDFTRQGNLS